MSRFDDLVAIGHIVSVYKRYCGKHVCEVADVQGVGSTIEDAATDCYNILYIKPKPTLDADYGSRQSP